MRLLSRYADMSNQQLEDLAGNLDSLTNVARLAIREEMERRGIGVRSGEAQPSDNSTPSAEESTPENPACSGEFVTIRYFDFPGELIVIQGLLESAGIKTLLVNSLNTAYLSLPLDGGWPIKLQVPKEHVARAMEILDSTLPDESESEE